MVLKFTLLPLCLIIGFWSVSGCNKSVSPAEQSSLVKEDPTSNQMSEANYQAVTQAMVQHQDIEGFLKQEPTLAKKTWAGTTLLFQAAFFNNPDAAKALIAHGADVNYKTQLGETPLDRAQSSKATEVIAILQSHGAQKGTMR